MVGHVAFKTAADRLRRTLSVRFTVDAEIALGVDDLLPALFGTVHKDELSCLYSNRMKSVTGHCNVLADWYML